MIKKKKKIPFIFPPHQHGNNAFLLLLEQKLENDGKLGAGSLSNKHKASTDTLTAIDGMISSCACAS
jgi:hypothetical protein